MKGDSIFRLAEAERDKPEWIDDLIRSETGKPVPNLANALLVLRNDETFAGMFALNEMLCAPVLLRPLGDETRPCRSAARNTAADSLAAAEQGHRTSGGRDRCL
jgi:hypothetical protein